MRPRDLLAGPVLFRNAIDSGFPLAPFAMEHGGTPLPELGARLRLRQSQFVQAARAIAAAALSTGTSDSALVRTRAELGTAIRQRRSAIVALASAIEDAERGIEAHDSYAVPYSEAAKDRLQSVAVPHLGAWPASRMVADRFVYANIAEKVLPDIILWSQQEVDELLHGMELASRRSPIKRLR